MAVQFRLLSSTFYICPYDRTWGFSSLLNTPQESMWLLVSSAHVLSAWHQLFQSACSCLKEGPLKLERVTSSGKWLPEIDGLRFLAIFAVLFVHVFGQCFNAHGGLDTPLSDIKFAAQVEHLARGVQLFFVISGFVLGTPFLKHFQDGCPAVDLKTFYKRRLTRLEPPYILSLFLYSSAFIIFRHRAVAPTLVSALYSVLYIHNFLPQPSTINNVTWTLEIEVQFYLITPLLALVFAVPDIALRRLTIAVTAVMFLMLPNKIPIQGFYLPGQLAFFLVGFLLADFRVLEQSARHAIWDAISILLWGAVFLMPDSWGEGPLVMALAGAFALSLRAPKMRWFLSQRPIAILGGMCYSLYLLHMLVIETFFPITRSAMIFNNEWTNVLTQILLLIPIILAAGLAYYLLIERPCMNPKWLENVLARTSK